MLTLIFCIITIYIIYKIIKNKKPTPTAFDLFLMEKYEESQRNAELMPTYVPTIEPTKRTTYDDDDGDANNIDEEMIELYLGMIKSNKYDTEGLRKEAIKMFNITEEKLDEMLKTFKPEKKSKNNTSQNMKD